MDFDAAIVGGGPAGCAAALTLRSIGHSATVVSDPYGKEKPTETSTPQLNWLLKELGADSALAACEPCFGISAAWGESSPQIRPAITNPFGNAWFVHRTRFDLLLQNAVRQAGAEWISAHVDNISFDPQGVSITTTRETIRARWFILASGSPSWTARITMQKQVVLDSLVGFWAHLPRSLNARTLFVEATEKGWWYVAPGDGQGTIGCFVTDGQSVRLLTLSQPANWNELFQSTRICKQLALEISAQSINKAFVGLSTLPQKFGTNWIVAGDAAVKLDPIGSSGLATALASGQRAAKAVSDALKGNHEKLIAYEKWSNALFKEFVRQREQHYEIEAKRRPSDFWTRRLSEAA